MFKCYHSNCLEFLRDYIINIINEDPIQDPFQSEIILVNNNYISKWIQIELAKYFNIIANVDFFNIDKFIRKIYIDLLPDKSAVYYFSQSIITWRLMKIIPDICYKKEFDIIRGYLNNDFNELKCFQLSQKLANLFMRYLLYRSDWLDVWLDNKLVKELDSTHQIWQAILWRKLVKFNKNIKLKLVNIVDISNKILFLIKTSKKLKLPKRIFICNITGLAPIYWKILNILSDYIDIYYLFNNPSRYFWSKLPNYNYLVNLIKLNRINCNNFNEYKLAYGTFKDLYYLFDMYSHDNKIIELNLLNLWGKLGYNDLFFISKCNNMRETYFFAMHKEDSLLHLLQNDILEYDYYSTMFNIINNINCFQKCNKYTPFYGDNSISIHKCCSIQHEVEILHDNLLSMLHDDKSLLMHEIIVMVNHIDEYIPIIKSVFAQSSGNNLSFVIVDTKLKDIHPIVSVFLFLLNLPYIRCTSEEILELLEVPSIALHFNISTKDFHILRKWILESGIRWGLDNDIFYELHIPTINEHTWDFGIMRMLLGYAMDSKYGDWQNIVSYDNVQGQLAYLVGRLGEFIKKLRYLRNKLKSFFSLEELLLLFNEIINDFFTPDEMEEKILLLLEKHWKSLLNDGIISYYNKRISIKLFREQFCLKLEDIWISKNFLSGGINFCRLTRMSSIPFKIVCLLGMGDIVYQNNLNIVNFDLMSKKFFFGDINQYDVYCYLFLEIILSVRIKLYISFVAYSLCDQKTFDACILINQLSEYISKKFFSFDSNIVEHKLNYDSVNINSWYERMNIYCAYDNLIVNNVSQSYISKQSKIVNYEHCFRKDYIISLPPKISLNTITLENLYNFYRNPIKYWMQKRLSIFLKDEQFLLPIHEPFIVDALALYRLNERLLFNFINNYDNNVLHRIVRMSGILPYGEFGNIYWIKQYQQMKILFSEIMEYCLSGKYNVEVNICIDNVKLSGYLLSVYNHGLLRWKPAILSVKDCLLLWLEHIVYCIMGGVGNSKIFGVKSRCFFPALSVEEATEYLRILISGYVDGLNTPLLLLHKSGGSWIMKCFDQKNNNLFLETKYQCEARKKLIESWYGNNYKIGENNDPYLKYLINDLNDNVIEQIILAATIYYLPILRFNIEKNNFHK